MGEEIIGLESSEECLPACHCHILFGYWFWLLVPEQIISRFVFHGIYLYQLCQLMVSCTPKGQAAGSLCFCHFCAKSKAVYSMTNGCSWNNESLFSKSDLLGKRLCLLRYSRLM